MPSAEELETILERILESPIHDESCGRGEGDEPIEVDDEDK